VIYHEVNQRKSRQYNGYRGVAEYRLLRGRVNANSLRENSQALLARFSLSSEN